MGLYICNNDTWQFGMEMIVICWNRKSFAISRTLGIAQCEIIKAVMYNNNKVCNMYIYIPHILENQIANIKSTLTRPSDTSQPHTN